MRTRLSLVAGFAISPGLISVDTVQSNAVLGGPSGFSCGVTGAAGGATGYYVTFFGGAGGVGGGGGGGGVVLFYITVPELLRTRLSFVTGFAISPGLISVETVQSKAVLGGPSGASGGEAGGGGGEGVVVEFFGGVFGAGGGDGGGGVVLFWMTPPVLLSTKLSFET